MNKSKTNYKFRLVESRDLQLLSEWLKEPLVSRWYTDPDYIDDLEDSLQDSRMRMQLVLLDDRPIAYVQDYDIHQWKDHHLAFLPNKSRGIDTFIGTSELIGKGHGTNYLSLLCTQLFSTGVPALGIDPHPDNIRARSVYQKVGFKEKGEFKSEWGKVMLMSLHKPTTRNQSSLL